MYDRVLRRKGKSRGQEVTRVEVRGKFKGAALIGSPSFIAFTIVPAVVVGPAENGQSSQLFSDANGGSAHVLPAVAKKHISPALLVRLSGKTSFIPTKQRSVFSRIQWCAVEEIVRF